MNALYDADAVRELLDMAQQAQIPLLFVTNNVCNTLLRYQNAEEVVQVRYGELHCTLHYTTLGAVRRSLRVRGVMGECRRRRHCRQYMPFAVESIVVQLVTMPVKAGCTPIFLNDQWVNVREHVCITARPVFLLPWQLGTDDIYMTSCPGALSSSMMGAHEHCYCYLHYRRRS